MIKKLLLTSALLGAMAVPAAAQFGIHVSFGKHRGKSGYQIAANLGNVVRLGVAKGHRDHGRRSRPVARGGHFHYVTEKVWVPGVSRRVFVPARYGYRTDRFGCRVRYCIAPAHYECVQEPGRWEFQKRRVWVRH